AKPVACRAGWIKADLVFVGFSIAIFSADLHHVPAGAHILGGESGGLSLGQYSASRRECTARVAAAETVGCAGGLAGRGDFCPASGPGGIRRLDYGTEKCSVPV